MRIAIDTQGKEIVNAQKEKPQQNKTKQHNNNKKHKPKTNQPKRLCRPLHNRFAIAPQADWNLAADSLICLVDNHQSTKQKGKRCFP